MQDIIIIGAGLMGAAATRHLATEFPDLAITVIGTAEPTDHKNHDGVFASHYDQGRITRVLDRSLIWGHMAKAAIDRYATIEAQSGITFHHRAGCLRVHDTETAVQEIHDVAQHYETTFDVLDTPSAHEKFPYFHFAGDVTAFDETGASGYVNPRQLVQAQLTAAQKHGATLIREQVTGFTVDSDAVTVTTTENHYQARKILLTAGGFTNLLLDKKLDLKMIAHNILLAELPESETDRLATMPALITSCDNPAIPSLYVLPPIPYPDGKSYIKLGGSFYGAGVGEPYIHTRDELTTWFQSDGNAEVGALLKEQLHTLMPDLNVLSYHLKPCVLTMTAHGNPYIGKLHDRVYVTTGGNGAAAKSSDEIGRMGAMFCATDTWQSALTQSDFAPQWQP
ncbi:MAG: FAD-dependent oxidoreductase [Chloroflexota bacterium]